MVVKYEEFFEVVWSDRDAEMVRWKAIHEEEWGWSGANAWLFGSISTGFDTIFPWSIKKTRNKQKYQKKIFIFASIEKSDLTFV